MAPKTEFKSLVLLQLKCRSIHNKTLDFWNLIDTYNADVAMGTESWPDLGLKIHWFSLLETKRIPEASSCKYLGIISRSDLNWMDQLNYTAQNSRRHFTL